MREEYDAVSVPCLARNCGGEVWIYDQGKLHYYHKSGGDRPGGVPKLCDDCESSVHTAEVPCLNEAVPGVDGDHGCIGDGQVCLAEIDPKKAYWYVLNGQSERPRGVSYCRRCLDGTVYSADCRCKGCVGSGRVLVNGQEQGYPGRVIVNGHEKSGYMRMIEEGKPVSWPPRKCRDCRDYLKALVDVTAQCSSCLGSFVFTAHQQAVRVLYQEPSARTAAARCPRCTDADPAELRRIKQNAHRARRAWERRAAFNRMERSSGRWKALTAVSMEALDRAIAAQRHVFPDDVTVQQRERELSLERATLGGDEAVWALATALTARGSEPGSIQRALANPALGDRQAVALTRALGTFAAGDGMPTRLMQHYASRYDLPVTTAFAGIHSDLPKHAQAAAYEVVATAAILANPNFPVYFEKRHIEAFHERMGTDPDFSACRSFESDVLIGLDSGDNVLIDFKHSIPEKPHVSAETLDKIEHGLTHWQIQRAIFVVNVPLPAASAVRVIEANARLAEYARETGWPIPPIEVFVQPWP